MTQKKDEGERERERQNLAMLSTVYNLARHSVCLTDPILCQVQDYMILPCGAVIMYGARCFVYHNE
jgi:hypothetical protein